MKHFECILALIVAIYKSDPDCDGGGSDCDDPTGEGECDGRQRNVLNALGVLALGAWQTFEFIGPLFFILLQPPRKNMFRSSYFEREGLNNGLGLPFAHSSNHKVLRNTLWLSRLNFFAALRANPRELTVIPRPLRELLGGFVLTARATTRRAPRIARILDVRFSIYHRFRTRWVAHRPLDHVEESDVFVAPRANYHELAGIMWPL